MTSSAGRKPTRVNGHKRSGRAVSPYVQMREAAKETQRKKGSVSAGGRAQSLRDVASSPTYEMSSFQWKDLIVEKEGSGPPADRVARFQDGTLHIGKRHLVVTTTRVFTYLHDEPSTVEVEAYPHEVEARDTYEIFVPEGAHVNYEKIRRAFEEQTSEKFSAFIRDETYGSVDLESVFVQEWEVVPPVKSNKVWSLQRELWEDGFINHEQKREERAK